MGGKSLNLSRRKFMIMSSAGLASPFIPEFGGLVHNAQAAEGSISYVISDDCIGCHFCFYECPASAIHWGDSKYVIDQGKCIQCGTCAEVCNIGAAHRQVVKNPTT